MILPQFTVPLAWLISRHHEGTCSCQGGRLWIVYKSKRQAPSSLIGSSFSSTMKHSILPFPCPAHVPVPVSVLSRTLTSPMSVLSRMMMIPFPCPTSVPVPVPVLSRMMMIPFPCPTSVPIPVPALSRSCEESIKS